MMKEFQTKIGSRQFKVLYVSLLIRRKLSEIAISNIDFVARVKWNTEVYTIKSLLVTFWIFCLCHESQTNKILIVWFLLNVLTLNISFNFLTLTFSLNFFWYSTISLFKLNFQTNSTSLQTCRIKLWNIRHKLLKILLTSFIVSQTSIQHACSVNFTIEAFFMCRLLATSKAKGRIRDPFLRKDVFMLFWLPYNIKKENVIRDVCLCVCAFFLQKCRFEKLRNNFFIISLCNRPIFVLSFLCANDLLAAHSSTAEEKVEGITYKIWKSFYLLTTRCSTEQTILILSAYRKRTACCRSIDLRNFANYLLPSSECCPAGEIKKRGSHKKGEKTRIKISQFCPMNLMNR